MTLCIIMVQMLYNCSLQCAKHEGVRRRRADKSRLHGKAQLRPCCLRGTQKLALNFSQTCFDARAGAVIRARMPSDRLVYALHSDDNVPLLAEPTNLCSLVGRLKNNEISQGFAYPNPSQIREHKCFTLCIIRN